MTETKETVCENSGDEPLYANAVKVKRNPKVTPTSPSSSSSLSHSEADDRPGIVKMDLNSEGEKEVQLKLMGEVPDEIITASRQVSQVGRPSEMS